MDVRPGQHPDPPAPLPLRSDAMRNSLCSLSDRVSVGENVSPQADPTHVSMYADSATSSPERMSRDFGQSWLGLATPCPTGDFTEMTMLFPASSSSQDAFLGQPSALFSPQPQDAFLGHRTSQPSALFSPQDAFLDPHAAVLPDDENLQNWGFLSFVENSAIQGPSASSTQALLNGFIPIPPVDARVETEWENMLDAPPILNTTHTRISLSSVWACDECGRLFDHIEDLRDHTTATQHRPHSCRCGQQFSRSDCLTRHIQDFQEPRQFPCQYCTKFRGTHAFSRRDKLLQHLRQLHRIDPNVAAELPARLRVRKRTKTRALTCQHINCQQLPLATFTLKSDLTEHCKKEHDESPYPCLSVGCSRTGGRGFFSKKGLLHHQQREHMD